jgi:hypothetical protein
MPMRDWKSIARASGLASEAIDLGRIAGPLESLETLFRPLVKDLPADLEPALEFHAEADAE